MIQQYIIKFFSGFIERCDYFLVLVILYLEGWMIMIIDWELIVWITINSIVVSDMRACVPVKCSDIENLISD